MVSGSLDEVWQCSEQGMAQLPSASCSSDVSQSAAELQAAACNQAVQCIPAVFAVSTGVRQ